MFTQRKYAHAISSRWITLQVPVNAGLQWRVHSSRMRNYGCTDMVSFGILFCVAFAAGLTANNHIKGLSGRAGKQGQIVHVTFFPAGELH